MQITTDEREKMHFHNHRLQFFMKSVVIMAKSTGKKNGEAEGESAGLR